MTGRPGDGVSAAAVGGGMASRADPNFRRSHWPERMLIILAMVAKFFFF